MKKFFSVFALSIILISGTFAKNIYSGDIQANIGYSFGLLKLTQTEYGIDVKTKMNSNLFNASVQTYQLFNLNNSIALGGHFGATFGVGKTTKVSATAGNITLSQDIEDNTTSFFHFMVGPAAGFSVGNVLKLNIAFGADFSFGEKIEYKNQNASFGLSPSVGLYVDVQGKLFPKTFFSPIIGYRFESFNPTERFNTFENTKTTTAIKSGEFSVNTIYIGCSINW